jgi:hypothetical protein
MKWRLLTTQDCEEWGDTLRRFPTADAYFLPEYHRAYELNGDGRALAFVAQDGDDLLFYPFLLRPIEKVGDRPVSGSWQDISTVYGYSGPLSSSVSPYFLSSAWAAFATWCEQQQIVAEFIRFNSLAESHRYVGGWCEVAVDGETVALDLHCSEEELWSGYPSVQRNMVRKAIRSGLVCEQTASPEDVGAFRALYEETMDRIGASSYYYFTDAYFRQLFVGLGDGVKLFVVRGGGDIVAAALFLDHGERIHYHLAGSDTAHRDAAPGNLLLHTVAEWGRNLGYRWLHLGGGITASPDDPLLRFKASLSKLRLPFRVGKRVHNREVYDGLCSQWMRGRSMAARPSYFLLYRLDQEAVQD